MNNSDNNTSAPPTARPTRPKAGSCAVTPEQKRERDRDAKHKCTFCGKTEDDVRTLIVSPNANICNECVDKCVAAIREHRELRACANEQRRMLSRYNFTEQQMVLVRKALTRLRLQDRQKFLKMLHDEAREYTSQWRYKTEPVTDDFVRTTIELLIAILGPSGPGSERADAPAE